MVRYDKSTARKGARYVRDKRDRVRGGGRRTSGGGAGGGRRTAGGVAAGGGLIGVIVAVLVALGGLGGGGGGGGAFGIDTTAFDQGAGPLTDAGSPGFVDPDADTIEFLEFLMFDIQDTWSEYFERAGLNYQETTLTVFDDDVDTGCGRATSSVGPFYCPAPNDRGVYIDLSFYQELATRFGAPGDFAQAYVIAHEVGHHIQAITGISDAVRRAQTDNPGLANEYSKRQELQADCLAGVWAHSASQRLTEESGRPIIEPGDIEEGLQAAASVGDDQLQAQAGLRISPETWTHGSSEQRVRWFTEGFETGDPERCDTFGVDEV